MSQPIPPPPPPSPPKTSFMPLYLLGGAICVLLVVLIVVIVTGDGAEEVAATTTPETTTTVATTDSTTATTAAATTKAAPTTAAPTTTAPATADGSMNIDFSMFPDGTAADDVAPAEDDFGSRRMGLVGDEFIPWNLMIPEFDTGFPDVCGVLRATLVYDFLPGEWVLVTARSDDRGKCWDRPMTLVFPQPISDLTLGINGADCTYTLTGYDSNSQFVDESSITGIAYEVVDIQITSADGSGEPIASAYLYNECGVVSIDYLTWVP